MGGSVFASIFQVLARSPAALASRLMSRARLPVVVACGMIVMGQSYQRSSAHAGERFGFHVDFLSDGPHRALHIVV